MSDSEHLLNTLRNFCDAYPESIFPTPPEDQRAKDAAVADVMREMALPWFERAADRIEELEDTATADQSLLEWNLENAKAALGKAQLQADRIDELEEALREIREAPICGDPQHRHTGTCGPYRGAGMVLMRDIARRAL